MKLPEKAPEWLKILEANPAAILDFTRQDILAEANQDYLYWDDFKYKQMPEGVTPEEAWAALKLTRMGNRKSIFLSDTVSFSYWLPSPAYEHLHFIDMNAGGQILQEDKSLLNKERPRYIIRSLVEEAIASSQIEGAATTRQAAKEMFRTGRQPRDYGEKMIFNNYRTIQTIKDRIREPLSVELLNELHTEISKGTLDNPLWEGRLRTEEVEVHDTADRIVLYTPPPASEVPDALNRLCAFANSEGDDFVHPAIKGIILHFWLAWIHPYMDGNGRIARALFYWYMLKKEYWLFEFLSISSTILKRRIQYYKSFLYSEVDENDMTYFLIFHLRAIREAVDDVREYIGRKEREKRAAMAFLKKFPSLNVRQRALLASALEKPDEIYTFETHAAIHGVVYQSARTDILGLHKLGLLEMRKAGNKLLFSPVKELKEKLME